MVATRVSERPHGAERSRPPQRREGGGWREVLRPTAQTTFSAWRHGVLTEPVLQGGAVTVGYVAAPVPLLAVPLLAGAAGEAVDAGTLRFFLARSLAEEEEEEEEEEEVPVQFPRFDSGYMLKRKSCNFPVFVLVFCGKVGLGP